MIHAIYVEETGTLHPHHIFVRADEDGDIQIGNRNHKGETRNWSTTREAAIELATTLLRMTADESDADSSTGNGV